MCFTLRKCGLKFVIYKLGEKEFGQDFFIIVAEFCKGCKVADSLLI